MSGMDRLTDAELHPLTMIDGSVGAMARELLTHRRASQAAPAPSDGLREAVSRGAEMVKKQHDGTYRVEKSGFNMYEDALEHAVRAVLTTARNTSPNAQQKENESLREALQLALNAMDYLADILNGMDAVTIEDVAATKDAFEKGRAALSASPAQEGGE